MKQPKPSDRWPLRKLWDDEAQRYTDDEEEMAEIILRHARARQGTARPTTTAGQRLLDDWAMDLSKCRTKLTLTVVKGEMAEDIERSLRYFALDGDCNNI